MATLNWGKLQSKVVTMSLSLLPFTLHVVIWSIIHIKGLISATAMKSPNVYQVKHCCVKKDELCAAVMKLFIRHQSYIPHCHVYQTRSCTKLCSCTKYHQSKRHIHICEPVFGSYCSLEVCWEIKEGFVYFKTLQEWFRKTFWPILCLLTVAFNAQYVFA